MSNQKLVHYLQFYHLLISNFIGLWFIQKIAGKCLVFHLRLKND